MFLTNVLLKRAKSKSVMVLMESVVTGHKFVWIRERLADKLEMLRIDPYIKQECIYKEIKKVRSV
ncbi:39S ribosomal protein L33, mitochondrial-like [Ctenocephalides felis]|uniref:39S ribosomal protein L33, mitochondrial-like n=1 Tax=Ctenocephalides felis TaxID=7515 RepID=UPI000E6E4464|nr:39S ribosomal protein L33, mitochondrial-like [Ctenocephalides felis]XP_026465556.1 39S ribosomal protein L33, mitochondrial-like [Ctenocephalides felis]XP_026465736.1 39S ribosomal protein L33, mitochondrial-like [Ctenocephalides felis]